MKGDPTLARESKMRKKEKLLHGQDKRCAGFLKYKLNQKQTKIENYFPKEKEQNNYFLNEMNSLIKRKLNCIPFQSW